MKNIKPTENEEEEGEREEEFDEIKEWKGSYGEEIDKFNVCLGMNENLGVM
jgi:hypothetical protein